MMRNLSAFILPTLILYVIIYGMFKGIDIFSEFLEGIKESIKISIKILPNIAGIMIAIAMLRESGLLEMIISFFNPVFKFFNIPSEILPLALLKPVTGSGSLAVLSDIIKKTGSDSLAGITASVICGSTETTFYTLSVYFGAVGIKNTRHTLKCALIADFVSIISGIVICKLLIK